jgi:hypothetical protein
MKLGRADQVIGFVAERIQLAGHVVSCHAGFDPDEASRHIRESCGNPAPRDFLRRTTAPFSSCAATGAAGGRRAQAKLGRRRKSVRRNILRHCGVDIGKRDFLGAIPIRMT